MLCTETEHLFILHLTQTFVSSTFTVSILHSMNVMHHMECFVFVILKSIGIFCLVVISDFVIHVYSFLHKVFIYFNSSSDVMAQKEILPAQLRMIFIFQKVLFGLNSSVCQPLIRTVGIPHDSEFIFGHSFYDMKSKL